MKRLAFFYSLAAIVLASSCSKIDPNVAHMDGHTNLIKKVIYYENGSTEGVEYAQYEYNSDCTLSRGKYEGEDFVLARNGNTLTLSTPGPYYMGHYTLNDVGQIISEYQTIEGDGRDWTYNEAGQLVRMGTNNCEFEWKDGNLTNAYYLYGDGRVAGSEIYTYSSDVTTSNFDYALYVVCSGMEFIHNGYYGKPSKNICTGVYDGNNNPKTLFKYKLDEQKRITELEITEKRGKGKVYKVVFEY